MKSAWIVGGCLLAGLASTNAAPQVEAKDADFLLLAEATIFKVGLVGLVPHISDEEQALVRITSSPDAPSKLLFLLEGAHSNEGRMYALCGIRQLSRSLFDAHASKAKWSGNTFNRFNADVVMKSQIEDQLRRTLREPCGLQMK